MAWALTLSFQKSGALESRSISSMRDRLRSRSKMPPERVQARAKVQAALLQVHGHFRRSPSSFCGS
jgi:hypothetical protein